MCVFRTNVCARVSLFDYQLALLSMCAILIGSSRAVKDFGNFSRILRKFIGIEKPVLIELDFFFAWLRSVFSFALQVFVCSGKDAGKIVVPVWWFTKSAAS